MTKKQTADEEAGGAGAPKRKKSPTSRQKSNGQDKKSKKPAKKAGKKPDKPERKKTAKTEAVPVAAELVEDRAAVGFADDDAPDVLDDADDIEDAQIIAETPVDPTLETA